MRYISLDIETTGIDPEQHEILSIGAVIEDTNNKVPLEELPKFYAIIPHKNITGNIKALDMNRELISIINEYNDCDFRDIKELEDKYKAKFYSKENIVEAFSKFCFKNDIVCSHYNITFAGKNFGTFDKLFLEKLPHWKERIHTAKQIIDPAILYTDWKKDNYLPSLSLCKIRLGIEGIVTHNALDDALDVVKILRNFY